MLKAPNPEYQEGRLAFIDEIFLEALTGIPEFDVFETLEASAVSGTHDVRLTSHQVTSDFREAMKQTIPQQMDILFKILPRTTDRFSGSRTEIWACTLLYHQAKNGYSAFSRVPSKAKVLFAKDWLKENLYITLQNKDLQTRTSHLIQTILDCLVLNLGVEVSFRGYNGRDTTGRLKNLFCIQGIMELWIEVSDGPSVIIKEYTERVPFLWATSLMLRIHMIVGLENLRPLWFRGRALEPHIVRQDPKERKVVNCFNSGVSLFFSKA
jgi:hypothetical protein